VQNNEKKCAYFDKKITETGYLFDSTSAKDPIQS